MKDNFLELLTEEGRKLHEEFMNCETQEDIDVFFKKVEKFNESRKNNEIPYYDMTAEEYCKKYNLVSLEAIMERNGIK